MGANETIDPEARAKPWRLRHPRVARAVLYGGFAALAGAGALVASRVREDARQQGLLTLLHGVETAVRAADPATALRVVREDVLARGPDEDVRRRALLSEAASLDALRRFDEAEAAYGRLDAEWPSGLDRGALTLPWANMRVRAGRRVDALALLDAEGATAGEAEADVAAVRAAATRPLVPYVAGAK